MAKHPLPVDVGSDLPSPPPQKKKKKQKKNGKKDDEEILVAGGAKALQTSGELNDKSDRSKSTCKDGDYVESQELSALPQPTIDEFLNGNSVNVTDPSGKSTLRPIISFEHLPPVSNDLYDSLKGFSKPTPIQSATWPLLFSGRDVIGVAQTGSGKTLAFGIPCLHRLMRKRSRSSVTAAIITPTRELAIQVYDQLMKCAPAAGISVACIYGGAPKDEQRKAVKKASVVVATPGRLKDLLGEQSVSLKKVKYLVLDEADRMLDKGFEQDIRDIAAATAQKKRQTVMFTATWPVAVRELAASFTTDAVNVTIGEASNDLRANTSIKQVVEVLQPHEKLPRLLGLLRTHQNNKNSDSRILVFCLYKKEAVRVEHYIRSKGFRVGALHGDMNQSERLKNLNDFKESSGKSTILVATDVAARGLDIPAVKLVLNVTFPLTAEDYVHRIGRTGRAGAEGLAITLFTENDKAQSGALINVLRAAKQDVPEELLKFGTTVKKKQHDSYGAFFRDVDTTQTATKIKFDD